MLEQLIISTQIVLINIVMAADNVIIISIIAANFAPNNRKKIIAWGVAAALFLEYFATGVNYLFALAWVKILGGLLLIWVINNLRQDFFGKNRVRSPDLKSKESRSFGSGVYQVYAQILY